MGPHTVPTARPIRRYVSSERDNKHRILHIKSFIYSCTSSLSWCLSRYCERHVRRKACLCSCTSSLAPWVSRYLSLVNVVNSSMLNSATTSKTYNRFLESESMYIIIHSCTSFLSMCLSRYCDRHVRKKPCLCSCTSFLAPWVSRYFSFVNVVNANMLNSATTSKT